MATPALACERVAFEGARFTVCAFDSDAQEMRLVWDDGKGHALGSFNAFAKALGNDQKRVSFAMNAGMYTKSGAPVGLFISGGREAHPVSRVHGGGNFGMKPNGVFSIDADRTIHIETTEAYIARAPHPAFATQSGPMLVIDGKLHPAFEADGASRYRRNGVGQIDAHHAVFAISDEPVSFGRFARFFRDRFKCANALYFDGAVSSLWAPDLKRRDVRVRLGPMIAVLNGVWPD